ncbi:hypothetical protein AB0I72_28165 [Nocardiopsis sp. NPDC049922]|uniref:hypothetical protein n=1 Tax=Nocardiopsis sp. NPDC049922 TaxID=3155157 RepID=UPI0033D664C3
MTVYRTMGEKFARQRLTDHLLQALARTGPGGLITANPDESEYRLTHHRWLDTTSRETIVYGYGDLIHDLDWALLLPPERAWDALVATADHIAHACLEWDPWEPTHPRPRTHLGRLRREMLTHGFVLLRRPVYIDRTDGEDVYRLQDTYLDTVCPNVAVTVSTPYPDTAAEDASTLTWFTDQGAFVTSWRTPDRELCRLPGAIRDRVTAHLSQDA